MRTHLMIGLVATLAFVGLTPQASASESPVDVSADLNCVTNVSADCHSGVCVGNVGNPIGDDYDCAGGICAVNVLGNCNNAGCIQSDVAALGAVLCIGGVCAGNVLTECGNALCVGNVATDCNAGICAVNVLSTCNEGLCVGNIDTTCGEDDLLTQILALLRSTTTTGGTAGA